MNRPRGWYRRCALLFAVVFTQFAGCQHTTWNSPRVANPKSSFDGYAHPPSNSTLCLAETAYASAFELEANGKASCVDHYFRAATLAWSDVEAELTVRAVADSRAGEIYRSAVSKLISTGQRFRRFDPSRGFLVQTAQGSVFVPTAYHGFPRRPDMFDEVVPVGNYRTKELTNSYSSPGLGVAAVVLHHRRPQESFHKSQQAFAATAVLRPSPQVDVQSATPFALEFFDSLRLASVEVAGCSVPLSRDITAPIVYGFKDVRRSYLDAFLQPGASASETGLFMLEPYQRGKIPVVFVHGLLSDPLTWGNIANEIQARPDLMERYQIWGFEYATGEPFLKSAAVLRDQLRRVQLRSDASGFDEALRQTVLVGHSMGGLVSKLQVTYSGQDVWQAMSNRPFESIVTTPQTRKHLADSTFFAPTPTVSRVVYVASPHRGSPWARRPIGRIGASLVEEPSSMQAEHQQLIRDNSGAFYEEFTRRIPTSLDLLRSDSRLLQAIDRLPVERRVREHSIVGSFRPMIGFGDSDGVVPVTSARRPGAISEKLIRGKHSSLHQKAEAIEELLRILRQHANEFE